MYVQPETFSEFFGMPQEYALDALGGSGYRVIDAVVATQCAERLDRSRWDNGAGALLVSTHRPSVDDPAEIATEDTVLADFVASRLPKGHGMHFGPLLLEAYARYDELGRTPGSSAFDVISRDSRMRLTAGDSARQADASIARADELTYAERMRARWRHHS